MFFIVSATLLLMQTSKAQFFFFSFVASKFFKSKSSLTFLITYFLRISKSSALTSYLLLCIFSFLLKMVEFLKGEFLSISRNSLSYLAGIVSNFFRRGDSFLLYYMTIFYFFSELPCSFIRKVETDFDFLLIGGGGDSIFFRMRLEFYSFFQLLNCFQSARRRGFFSTFKSQTFRLRILYLYS